MHRTLKTAASLLLLACSASQSIDAAERPTFNITCDPRPDILPHPHYYSHTEYRRAYNRPSYVGGWFAYHIAPSSQEAMVWHENLHAGNYDRKHMPPVYKYYYAPKPWEALETGPRPDFVQVEAGDEIVVPLEESLPNSLREGGR